MGIYGYFLNVQIEKAGKNRYHNFEFRIFDFEFSLCGHLKTFNHSVNQSFNQLIKKQVKTGIFFNSFQS